MGGARGSTATRAVFYQIPRRDGKAISSDKAAHLKCTQSRSFFNLGTRMPLGGRRIAACHLQELSRSFPA
jgi:hypothetical protein